MVKMKIKDVKDSIITLLAHLLLFVLPAFVSYLIYDYTNPIGYWQTMFGIFFGAVCYVVVSLIWIACLDKIYEMR